MKYSKLTACLLALTIVTGVIPAFGQNTHPAFSLGIGAQYWEPKDIDDLDEDGFWGANLIARFQPSAYFGIDLRAGGSGVWDGETYYVGGTKYETDVTFMCCPFEAGVVFMLPLGDVVTLYAGPGVGYYYYDIDIETSSKHHHHYHSEWSEHIELEDDFGWYAVGGLKIQLASCFSIFGEVRYTDTKTSLKHFDSAEFDCSGIGFQGGIMFDF
jgi:opacity protein-like surface antigen